jgi:hypothetical protein
MYSKILIEKEYNIHVDWGIIEKTAASIENIDDYKINIQVNFLDIISAQSQKNESFFQGLVYSLNALAFSANPLPRFHEGFSEVITMENKRIYGYFIPPKGKSETAIIHEYKYIESSDFEKKLTEALWQIFINAYLSQPIRNRQQSEYSHINHAIARGVVFFKKNLCGSWGVEMKEYKFEMSQAEQVVENFKRIQKTEVNNLRKKLSEPLLDSLIESLKADSGQKKVLPQNKNLRQKDDEIQEEEKIPKKRGTLNNPKGLNPQKRQKREKIKKRENKNL